MNLPSIFLTSVLTIIGGVLVFSLSQIIQRFLLEPVHEQAKAIGEIFFGLIYYAPWYANPGCGKPEELAAASDTIRRYASQLQSTTNAIRFYGLFELCRLLPKRAAVYEAIDNLIRISNSIYSGNGRENRKDADDIKRLLSVSKEKNG